MHSVHILVPAQRYVFSLDGRGGASVEDLESSADGFRRYKELQAAGKPTGMVAFPNTCLIRADRDYLVDPGLVMQGGPVFGALEALDVDPGSISVTPPSISCSRMRARITCSAVASSMSMDGTGG
jgi:hypothetical protein